MGNGPGAGPGYDLALTELVAGERHEFLVDVGTQAGASVVAGVPHAPAAPGTTAAARSAVAEATGHMGRSMPATGLRELMAGSYDAARWDDVASRCLTCGNCTLACPTCFCTTVEDVTDLSGDHAEDGDLLVVAAASGSLRCAAHCWPRWGSAAGTGASWC